MSFADLFFGSDSLISCVAPESKDKSKKEENLEWISDEFLDSIWKTYTDDSNTIFDQIFTDENDLSVECSSDNRVEFSSGMFTEPVDTWALNNAAEEDLLVVIPEEKRDDEVMTASFETVNFIKEEEVECEEVYDIENFDSLHEMSDQSATGDDGNELVTNFSSDDSMSSSKDEFDKVSVKSPRPRHTHSRVNNYSRIQRLRKKKLASEEELNGVDEADFPRLKLTPEEQKLAIKEGIKLPFRYPLTKAEEKDLKRIRRKIRNKISAQDSRRRRKEYVDGLEERIKQTTEENANLLERVKTLEEQKMTLVVQVKKLRAALARCSGQTAQPSTCLLVLMMSLALIMAPNLKNSSNVSANADDEGISLAEDGSTPLNSGRSRNLLFSEKSTDEFNTTSEDTKILAEQIEKMKIPEANVLTNVLEFLNFAKPDSLLEDHDYFRTRKRSASDSGEESWPPSKMMFKMASGLKTLAGNFMKHKKKPDSFPTESVIIDMLDECK